MKTALPCHAFLCILEQSMREASDGLQLSPSPQPATASLIDHAQYTPPAMKSTLLPSSITHHPSPITHLHLLILSLHIPPPTPTCNSLYCYCIISGDLPQFNLPAAVSIGISHPWLYLAWIELTSVQIQTDRKKGLN